MKRGDFVKYRSIGGSVYDAEVVAVRDDGRIDIEAIVPPAARVFLSRIVVAMGPAERHEAFAPG